MAQLKVELINIPKKTNNNVKMSYSKRVVQVNVCFQAILTLFISPRNSKKEKKNLCGWSVIYEMISADNSFLGPCGNMLKAEPPFQTSFF